MLFVNSTGNRREEKASEITMAPRNYQDPNANWWMDIFCVSSNIDFSDSTEIQFNKLFTLYFRNPFSNSSNKWLHFDQQSTHASEAINDFSFMRCPNKRHSLRALPFFHHIFVIKLPWSIKIVDSTRGFYHFDPHSLWYPIILLNSYLLLFYFSQTSFDEWSCYILCLYYTFGDVNIV